MCINECKNEHCSIPYINKSKEFMHSRSESREKFPAHIRMPSKSKTRSRSLHHKKNNNNNNNSNSNYSKNRGSVERNMRERRPTNVRKSLSREREISNPSLSVESESKSNEPTKKEKKHELSYILRILTIFHSFITI